MLKDVSALKMTIGQWSPHQKGYNQECSGVLFVVVILLLTHNRDVCVFIKRSVFSPVVAYCEFG